MRLATALAALPCTIALGCLDITNAAQPDAGIEPAACGDPGEFDARPFPPPTASIGIGAVEVADLNDDGQDDLVFLNSENVDPSDQGFYILLGPNAEDLQYHAFVPTVSEPFAMEVFQFAGDGCLDVAVFGVSRDGNPAGIIEIWENIGPQPMFANAPEVTRNVDFVPDSASTVQLEVGTLESDQLRNDFALSDGTNLMILTLDGTFVDDLPTATARFVAPDGTDTPNAWTAINGIAFETSKPIETFDDLLILEATNATWLVNDGSAALGELGTGNSSGEFDLGSLAVTDLDGNDTPDLIGGSANDFGAYLLRRTSTDAFISAVEWTGGSLAGVAELEDIVVADLNGTGGPEVVVLDRAPPSASTARLISDLDASEGALEPAASSQFDFDGINPGFGRVLDFDGTGDKLWVLDPISGDVACLVVTGGALADCP